jgi:hypothetical protein
MQSTFGIFDDLTGSVFFGEHDREDAGGFFWVSWILGTVPHRLIVVVVFEKEPVAVNLEAAEIMLLVWIVSEVNPPNVRVSSSARALTTSAKALTALVITTRPRSTISASDR